MIAGGLRLLMAAHRTKLTRPLIWVNVCYCVGKADIGRGARQLPLMTMSRVLVAALTTSAQTEHCAWPMTGGAVSNRLAIAGRKGPSVGPSNQAASLGHPF